MGRASFIGRRVGVDLAPGAFPIVVAVAVASRNLASALVEVVDRSRRQAGHKPRAGRNLELVSRKLAVRRQAGRIHEAYLAIGLHIRRIHLALAPEASAIRQQRPLAVRSHHSPEVAVGLEADLPQVVVPPEASLQEVGSQGAAVRLQTAGPVGASRSSRGHD